MRVLKENFQALGIVVGQGLIQAFKPALAWINRALIAITEFAESVVNALGKIFGWQIDISAGSVDYGDDISSGIDDIGDSAGKAGKAVKDLKGQLQGFDKLNVLTTPNDGSGGGGGGGGGASGGGAGGGGDVGFSVKDTVGLFESEIDNLRDLGSYISQALGDAVANIKWDKIFEKARNFGKGLADFLNGLFATREDGGNVFSDVTKTIANALNAVVYAACEFAKTFDWIEFGKNLAVGINDFFATFDWKEAGFTVHTFIQGIKDALVTFLKTLKWKDILSGVGTFAGQLTPEDIALIFAAWGSMKVGSWVISGGLQQAIVGAIPKLASMIPRLLAPLGLTIVTAIASAVLAVGAAVLVKALFSKIGEMAGKTKEQIKQAGTGGTIGAIGGAILGIIATAITGGAGIILIPALTAIGTAIGEGLVYVIQGLKEQFKEFKEKFGKEMRTAISMPIDWSDVIPKMLEGLSELPKKIQEKIGEVLDRIDLTGIASKLGSLLGKAFGKAIKLGFDAIRLGKALIKTVRNKLVKFFTQGIPTFVKGIKDVDWWKVTKNIIEGILSFASNVGKTIKIVKDAVKSFFDSFIDGFKSVFGIHSPAKAKEIVDLGENIIKGILESVKSFLKSPGDFFSSIATSIIDGIKNGVTKIIGKGAKWLKKLFTGSDAGEFGVTAQVGTEKKGAWAKFKSLVGWITGNDTSKTDTNNYVHQNASSGWKDGLLKWITGSKKGESHTYNYVHQQKSSGWAGMSLIKWITGRKDGTTDTYNTVHVKASYGRYSSFTDMVYAGKTGIDVHAKMIIDKLEAGKGVHIDGTSGRAYINLATGGMLVGQHWKPIPQYAGGTLSAAQGQIFVAREAGPELVGSIGGHTAVMNNNQIVSSVAYGVRSAVSDAMQEQNAILRSQNTILTQILAKEWGITSGDVFNAVRSENSRYVSRTGRSAFSY